MYGTVATPEWTFHCIALPLTAKEAGQSTSKTLSSIIKSQFSKRKNPLRSLLANAPNGAYLLLWLLLCWMAVGLWCPPPTLAMLRLDLGEWDLPHTSSREIPPKTSFWLSIYVPYVQVKKENLWQGLYFPPCCEGLAALPSKHHQWPPDFNSHVSAQLFPAQFPWSVPVERRLVFLFQTPAGQTMLHSPPTHQCSVTDSDHMWGTGRMALCGSEGHLDWLWQLWWCWGNLAEQLDPASDPRPMALLPVPLWWGASSLLGSTPQSPALSPSPFIFCKWLLWS